MAKTATNATAAATRPARARKAPEEKQTANVAVKRNPPKSTTSKVTKKTSTAKAATTKKTATKPAVKKAPAKAAIKKTTKTSKAKPVPESPAANTSRKRKAESDDEERPVKKQAKAPAEKKIAPVKARKKGPVLREAPTAVFEVLACGEGSAGELGLGNARDVKRPRYNPALSADKVGVVQISTGGMHCAALTKDNKIFTWGVNDTGALGRDTKWDGGTKDMKEDDDSSDDEDSDMNPHETTPAAMDFSNADLLPDTRFVQVAAGDTCTFAVTDDGLVYGVGTFRAGDGETAFTPEVNVAERPILIDGLKNIVQIACGSTHALAVDNKGKVFAWGFGEQSQLGRRVVERTKNASLVPREVGMPRGAKNKIKSVASGPYHSFAISESGELFSWGLNSFGQTGVDPESAGESNNFTTAAAKVKGLEGKQITTVAGGSFHSIASTADGECLAWGRIDAGQLGIAMSELEKLGDEIKRNERGQLGLLKVPYKVSSIEGFVQAVSAGPEHSMAVTEQGKAYSTGFSSNYQTGQGTTDDIQEMTLISNTAINERTVAGVHAGAQYSMITTAYGGQ